MARGKVNKEKLFDLIAVIVIALAALLTAVVCFGFLESQAGAKNSVYSVGGAIAGALITIAVLTSTYLRIRHSSTEWEKVREADLQQIEALRRANQELEQKLIRGAPRPRGFETQVAERQRIVLGIPNDWEPRGGVLFDFELPADQMDVNDVFPARFTCSFSPLQRDAARTTAPLEVYASYLHAMLTNQFIESPQTTASELVYLGGESERISCLKIVTQEYVSVEVTKDEVTGKRQFYWKKLTPNDYQRSLEPAASTESPAAEGASLQEPKQDGLMKNNQANASTPSAPLTEDQRGTPSETQGSSITEQNEKENPAQAAQAIGEPQAADTDASSPSEGMWTAPIRHMSVICFYQELNTIFLFDFYDDNDDYIFASGVFNEILASVRFLS